ncbi:hypothetical transcript [Echinococcus multilocularis]|uniref:Hypothetical transcript n=1 Tax=Echinococcus multilocularis TaxID=6211 RepID=A0A068XUX0_ECHMU|nr:hypothetical transcript [Echinococcus multilocularis]
MSSETFVPPFGSYYILQLFEDCTCRIMSQNSLLYVDSLPASALPTIAYRANYSKFCIDFAELYDKSFYFMRLRPRTGL